MPALIAALLPSVAWTVLSGVAYTAGDIMLREWFAHHERGWFYLVFVIYMTGTACMMLSFFEQNIAIATVAAIVVNVIAYLAVAYFLYGDSVSPLQVFGILLGLASLAILEIA